MRGGGGQLGSQKKRHPKRQNCETEKSDRSTTRTADQELQPMGDVGKHYEWGGQNTRRGKRTEGAGRCAEVDTHYFGGWG